MGASAQLFVVKEAEKGVAKFPALPLRGFATVVAVVVCRTFRGFLIPRSCVGERAGGRRAAHTNWARVSGLS